MGHDDAKTQVDQGKPIKFKVENFDSIIIKQILWIFCSNKKMNIVNNLRGEFEIAKTIQLPKDSREVQVLLSLCLNSNMFYF